MNFDLATYATLVFDCDGVVLDSNKVKTEAFYLATLPYGEAAARAFVAYHTANGGISRYKKFAHFLHEIVPQLAEHSSGPTLDEMLADYAAQVRHGLLTCDVAPGLLELRQQTKQARWLIVSGGDQAELRDVFVERGLAELFDGGIFGSPDSKDTVLSREIANGNIPQPALFLGDSKYDHQAASGAGLDFIFLSGWSEVKDAEQWCQAHHLTAVHDLRALIS